MADKITIFALNNLGNAFREICLIKPKTYQLLIKELKLPENYILFYYSPNNEERIITNNEEYKSSKDILFIRRKKEEVDNKLEKSIFEINYSKLPESKQEKLDEKYNCSICQIMIKKENPYFCYTCQKIFHTKCLKDWEKKCKEKNDNLTCPNCRKELPLEEWKKKLDFEDNRKEEAENLNIITQFEKKNTLNMSKIKKLINDKNILYEKNEESNNICKNIYLLLINIISRIIEMNFIDKEKKEIIKNKLNNKIKKLNSKNYILLINDISFQIIDELDELEKYINLNKSINKDINDKLNIMKNEFRNLNEDNQKIKEENNILMNQNELLKNIQNKKTDDDYNKLKEELNQFKLNYDSLKQEYNNEILIHQSIYKEDKEDYDMLMNDFYNLAEENKKLKNELFTKIENNHSKDYYIEKNINFNFTGKFNNKKYNLIGYKFEKSFYSFSILEKENFENKKNKDDDNNKNKIIINNDENNPNKLNNNNYNESKKSNCLIKNENN